MSGYNALEGEGILYKAWGTATAGRGETVQIRPTTKKRKIGAYALEIAFDFTKAQKGTILGVYIGPEESSRLEIQPVAIGLWVYGTQEAFGYWLRMSFYDGKNKCKVLNLTDEKRGIDWVGWKYVKVDIPSYFEKPIKLFPKQLIRMMSISTGEEVEGPRSKGKIYIDGIKFYDRQMELPTPPSIGVVSVIEREEDLERNHIKVVIDATQTRDVSLQLYKTTLVIDGYLRELEEGQITLEEDGVVIKDIPLIKGNHTIHLKLEDDFGNEIRKEVRYEKKSGKSMHVAVHYPKEVLRVDGKIIIPVSGSIQQQDKQIQLRLGIKPIEVVHEVEFQLGIEGKWCQRGDRLLISMRLRGKLVGEEVPLAQIILKGIDRIEEEKLIFGEAQFLKEDEHCLGTQVVKGCEVPIISYYNLEIGNCIKGTDTTIKITDYLGNKVQGVNIFLERDKESRFLGLSDEEGMMVSKDISEREGLVYLRVEKEGKCSSPLRCTVYKPLLTQEPTLKMIHIGLFQHKKSLTWMTNPLSPQATQLRLIKGNTYQPIAINTQIQSFTNFKENSENGIVAMHQATLEVLREEYHYQYQIGYGDKWSEVYDLITHKINKESTSFIILGDMQSENVNLFGEILACVEKHSDEINFIAQLGDLVDEATDFGHLRKIIETIVKYKVGQIPWLHLLGNHEWMGDKEGKIAKHYFALPYKNKIEETYGCYSIDEEHVHIAVISYLHKESTFKEVGKWLVEDMQTSKKPWKILFTHQPPYFTNPDGGNEPFKEFFVPLIDAVGIDVVFSGHDHAYGRSFKLKGDKKIKVATTYFVCGTVGGKYYEAVNDGSFEVYSDKQEPLYMKVKIDEKEMHIQALRIDGTYIDEVILRK